MNRKLSLILICTLISLLIGSDWVSAASAENFGATLSPTEPLGSTFNYEGHLAESGNPADGSYDFQFILYDALSGGNQIGNINTPENIDIS